MVVYIFDQSSSMCGRVRYVLPRVEEGSVPANFPAIDITLISSRTVDYPPAEFGKLDISHMIWLCSYGMYAHQLHLTTNFPNIYTTS